VGLERWLPFSARLVSGRQRRRVNLSHIIGMTGLLADCPVAPKRSTRSEC
jgi:hypothetical protein